MRDVAEHLIPEGDTVVTPRHNTKGSSTTWPNCGATFWGSPTPLAG